MRPTQSSNPRAFPSGEGIPFLPTVSADPLPGKKRQKKNLLGDTWQWQGDERRAVF
jgi:hypothetical protein